MEFKNKKILLISTESWGVMKVSKHHYAIELANRGNQVYFLNPPNSDQKGVEKVMENLWVVNLPMYRLLNRIPISRRLPFHKRLAKKLVQLIGVEHFDVLWSFNPFVFQNLQVFNASLKIYHPVDLHMTKLDLEIAETADLILCTSNDLLKRYEKINVPSYQVNHGLTKSFLSANLNCEGVNEKSERLKICYVGNLQSRFLDFETLQKIVLKNNNLDFYFIGPDGKSNFGNDKKFDYSELRAQDNTYFLGTLESSRISQILGCFDAFLICYYAEDSTYLSNLHKTLEFLSTGKVIISNYVSQYQSVRHLLEMADRIEDLPSLFEKVISNIAIYNDDKIRDLRKDFARENTYEKQVDRIAQIVNSIE